MNPVIWLLVCLATAVGAIGGIVYLQCAGKAGKYAWTEKDTNISLGYLSRFAVVTLFVVFYTLAGQFTRKIVAPTLPPGATLLIEIISAVIAVVAVSSLLALLNALLKNWSVWQSLRLRVEHFEREEKTEKNEIHIDALISKVRAIWRRSSGNG
jgi:hypothetical protein